MKLRGELVTDVIIIRSNTTVLRAEPIAIKYMSSINHIVMITEKVTDDLELDFDHRYTTGQYRPTQIKNRLPNESLL